MYPCKQITPTKEAAGMQTKIDLESIDKNTLDGFMDYILTLGARVFQQPETQAAYRQWHIRRYGCPPKETFDHV